MKRHRLLTAAALLLALSLLITGCGGSSAASTAAASAEVATQRAPTAPAEMAVATDASGFANGSLQESDVAAALPADRKIVRNAWLSLETKEFDEALSALGSLISESGGYIEQQSEEGRSLYQNDGYYSRRATLTARIPAEKLDEVINRTGEICNIVSRSTSAEDITDRYYDSEAHLRSLELQEERLLEILSKAEQLEEVITLEQALSDVRYEIESLTAALRRMDSQVTYSSLSITLEEVVDYQKPATQPKSFGERVAAAWERSLNRVGQIAQELVIFVIEVAPSAVIFLLLPLALILLVIRLLTRHRRPGVPPRPSGKAPSSDQNQPPKQG